MSNIFATCNIMNVGQVFVKKQDFIINIIFLKVIPKYYIESELSTQLAAREFF